MTRLLVTGAGGVLGLAFLKKIPINKYTVFAVTTGRTKLPIIDGVTPVECDLLSEQPRRALIRDLRPDAVVHLAWNQSPGFRESDTNLEWLAVSIDLLHCFHKNGGKRFIFAGSSSEYDSASGRFSENEGAARTQYGRCKRVFTETAVAYGERFGVEVASARFFTIYGENDRHMFGAIPSAINAFLRGENVVCKAPDTARDYIYAGDAAAAAVKLLESGLTGAVNVASGTTRTMRDVFLFIAGEMGAVNLLSVADPPGPPDTLAADVGRMNKELGYTCETSFEDGLKKTIDWWRGVVEI